MKFNKVLDEKIIMDKGIKMGDDEFAFFYDITNSTDSKRKREMKECIIGGTEYGNAIRFIADGKNRKFIIFRPDCLHYRVAAELGYPYPKNEYVLFGTGIADISKNKIKDIDFSTFDEMPRNKETNKFFEKILSLKWAWASEYGDIEEALFESIMNDSYWNDQKKRHYEK